MHMISPHQLPNLCLSYILTRIITILQSGWFSQMAQLLYDYTLGVYATSDRNVYMLKSIKDGMPYLVSYGSCSVLFAFSIQAVSGHCVVVLGQNQCELKELHISPWILEKNTCDSTKIPHDFINVDAHIEAYGDNQQFISCAICVQNAAFSSSTRSLATSCRLL